MVDVEMDQDLSSTRQREMLELIEVLERFGPTKVAVEADVHGRGIARRYADYRAGEYTLSSNEIDQIGVRLAARMGHETVYSVDEHGEFPYLRVLNYAVANGQRGRFDSLQAIATARLEWEAEYQRTHTILETLTLMNADSTATTAVGEYYLNFLPFGEPWEHAGADLLAAWLQRNFRIYGNIRALATSSDDRVLVVYGAGHLGWLRQMVRDDPAVRLRQLSEFIDSPGEL